MHPALSVIFFTTASGAGYGVLSILGICSFFNVLKFEQTFLYVSVGSSLILITAGLLSSTFHLGHPERAWRALSQWRSSWLSREGVLAILSYIPMLIFTGGIIMEEPYLFVFHWNALCMSIMCLLTVYSTSMIYSSLNTIPAWCNKWVPLSYLLLAIMSGAVFLSATYVILSGTNTLLIYLSLVLIAGVALVKICYWKFIQREEFTSTAETATGLGEIGRVEMVQSPHTRRNYILKEMGYQIARKHAQKLRLICITCLLLMPSILILPGLFSTSSLASLGVVLACVFIIPGLLIERWLFFAEAKHCVTLFYGNSRV